MADPRPGAQRKAFTPVGGGQRPAGQLPGAQQKRPGGERTAAKERPARDAIEARANHRVSTGTSPRSPERRLGVASGRFRGTIGRAQIVPGSRSASARGMSGRLAPGPGRCLPGGHVVAAESPRPAGGRGPRRACRLRAAGRSTVQAASALGVARTRLPCRSSQPARMDRSLWALYDHGTVDEAAGPAFRAGCLGPPPIQTPARRTAWRIGPGGGRRCQVPDTRLK